MCHMSAGCIQEHIRPECNVDLIYDVTGVNGCIFGCSDLQPGCAAPISSNRDLQGLLYDGSYRLGVLQNGSYVNIFNV